MGLSDRPKWVVAAAAAVAGTSIGGALLLTGTGSASPLPGTVTLRDQIAVATSTPSATATPRPFDVRSGPIVRTEDGSFTLAPIFSHSDLTTNSVHTATLTVDSVTADSPNAVDTVSLQSPASVDSPNTVDTVDTSLSPDSADTTD